MLYVLLRLVRTRWTAVAVYRSDIWGRLLRYSQYSPATPTETLEADVEATAPETTEPIALVRNTYSLKKASIEINKPRAGSPGPVELGFPTLTGEQEEQLINDFITSLDADAICNLAASYNHGKPCKVLRNTSGSFNVCFFIKFDDDDDDGKVVVRIPIEPVVARPWEKVVSEVATIQYLQQKTSIPVPRIRGHGRGAKLMKDSSATQVYVVADLVEGDMLDKKLLIEGQEEHRKGFYSELIDILAELRKLEFPSIGSLLPNPDGGPHPIPSLPNLKSAKAYMKGQWRFVSDFFSPPVRDEDLDDSRAEIMALHHMEPIFDQFIDPPLDGGPFVLHHMDLRSPNIIVDKFLRIEDVIDWEFALTQQT
ncbi:Uncharacterized protein TCAP_06180 [Tolypocladium capitatum]|uniref:Aminoglycoside phosphotransferase domain-containing protein n=1 Tax=Tolypocladium capitatum TaxID=45235 RepID=A0A2K3Q8I6_9HYPO|nr:Uncharacterized protein TCAP_06180 [Tolypocladium capitatum]